MCSLLIPGLGFFFTIFMPLPFLYYFIKKDFANGMVVVGLTLVALTILVILIGAIWAPLILLQFGLISFYLSVLYKRGISISRLIWKGTVLLFFLNIGGILLWSLNKGVGPGEFISSYIRHQFDLISNAYNKEGLSPDKIVKIKEYGDNLSRIVSLTYPSIIFLGCGVTVWVNIGLWHHLFHKSTDLPQEYSDLHKWSSPEFLIWPYIVAGFSLFLFSGTVKWVSINLFLVLCGVYAFQGFHIFAFYLNKHRVQNLLKGIIYVFVFFQQICWIILLIAGIFDHWFNFRRLPNMNSA